MKYINISHRKLQKGTIHSFSSEIENRGAAENLLSHDGFWSTEQRSAGITEFVILSYGDGAAIDSIEIKPAQGGSLTFPRSFRFEVSDDAAAWKVLHGERGFELEGDVYRLRLPLMNIKYLKLVITEPAKHNGKYYVEIGSLAAGIAGVEEIKASSEASPEQGVGSLINNDTKAQWHSASHPQSQLEDVFLDLGGVYHLNRLAVTSGGSGFPEQFNVNISADNNLWLTLFEVKNFKPEMFKTYWWDINVTLVRYIRIEMKSGRTASGDFSVALTELEVNAAPVDYFHTHNIGELVPHASIFQAGLIRLGRDGDDSSGAAVQGSDRRLRDATTIFKGICQLAGDGDASEGLVVQASDHRLRQATDQNPGIVRLAYDRENQGGTAVQGNDSRLQEAGEQTYGIVKLCRDGLYTEHAVVKGNDSRLQKATIESTGICRLAEDGGILDGTVVQGSDSRLRKATIMYEGISRLAEDGEKTEGSVVQGNDRRLKNATEQAKGIVELAENGEDREGVAVQGNDRRLKDATTESKGIVELAKDGEEKEGAVVQSNDYRLKDASTESKGIIELAEDGETAAGVVVQGNDRRLRDATEVAKGIARFCSDGEEAPFTAVQGNDRRLKDSTTTAKGITELAEDGEERAGVVVQGNDRRLKDATTKTKGIVKLAENGEVRPGVAVQSDDDRLQEATETAEGILRFAEDGEKAALAAVQGNDRRLKDATTTAKGIVELAEDGENVDGVAVQGSDRRLKDATTTAKGIVEIAENGEEREGVVVQGNDRRLKEATENAPGIVRLAKSAEERAGFAVQAHDPRLSDSREALPHEHDYASKNHNFNSHKGTISINESKEGPLKGMTPVSDDSAVIYGNNRSDKDGAVGIAGIAGTPSEKPGNNYGVLGHSSHVGVRGQSAGTSEGTGGGIMGLSRFGAGGIFASEHNYSLVADGFGTIQDFDKTAVLAGNGKALLVRGESLLKGRVNLVQQGESLQSPGNIVEYFEADETEYISPGDLLVVSTGGDSILSRSRNEYSRGVIGVVAGNPLLTVDNSGKEEKTYPVVLAGKALCKVDARNRPVVPGDLIVTSSTPGCGMGGSIDSFDKIGTVVAKALEGLEDGIGTIAVFIMHQ